MKTRDGKEADRVSPYADISIEKDSALIRIAFIEFLDGWYDEQYEALNAISKKDKKVQRLFNKWVNQWLPSLKQPHCGDCTRVPCPCTRCHTEDKLNNAKYILSLIPQPYEN